MKSLSILLNICLVVSSSIVWAGVNPTDPDQNMDTVNQTVDGRKHGYWMIFAHMRNEPNYKPDALIEEGKYKMSRKTGIWKKYFPSGRKQSEITFKNGKAIGDFTTYYDNEENVIEESGNWGGKVFKNEFVRYHPNGQVAQRKNFNDQGKPEGKQFYYFENGQIELEFEMNNGIETGTATRFWPNGDVKEVINFDGEGKGTSGGEIARVNPPVVLESQKAQQVPGEGIVVDGSVNPADDDGKKIVDGYHKTYNDNKEILMDGEFKGGKLFNGKHYIYDEYGLLDKIKIYKNGKYIGNGVIE